MLLQSPATSVSLLLSWIFSNFFFFWPHHTACGTLIPWPGIKPVSPALKAWSVNHGTTREVPHLESWSTKPKEQERVSPPPRTGALVDQGSYVSFFFIIFFICGGFCHTLKWNSHGFTCVPHPDPPSHLPLHPIPLGLPSAPGPRACLMHPTWAGDLFHPRYYTCFDAVLLKHPTLAFSHRV